MESSTPTSAPVIEADGVLADFDVLTDDVDLTVMMNCHHGVMSPV